VAWMKQEAHKRNQRRLGVAPIRMPWINTLPALQTMRTRQRIRVGTGALLMAMIMMRGDSRPYSTAILDG